MVTDEILLTVVKDLLGTMAKISAQNTALWILLKRRGLASDHDYHSVGRDALALYAPVLEKIQNTTLRTLPDILKDFSGPIQ